MVRIIFIHSVLLTSLLFLSYACNKADEVKIEEHEILGSWKTIKLTEFSGGYFSDDENGVTAVWGCCFVNSFELLNDGTLNYMNGNLGKWKLDERSGTLSIFDINDDTLLTLFDVHLDKQGFLFLQNEDLVIKNKKI